MAPKRASCGLWLRPTLRKLLASVEGGEDLLGQWAEYIQTKKALQSTLNEAKARENEAAGARTLAQMELLAKGYKSHDAKPVVLAEQARAAAVLAAEANSKRVVSTGTAWPPVPKADLVPDLLRLKRVALYRGCRALVAERKAGGTPFPWTTGMDPHTKHMLDHFKFCNVFRADDKTSRAIALKISIDADPVTLMPNVLALRELNSVEFVTKFRWASGWGDWSDARIVVPALMCFHEVGHAFSDAHHRVQQ